jgi:5-methylcytosine-specific restriction protein A
MPKMPDGKPQRWHAKPKDLALIDQQYHTWKWVKYRAYFLKTNPVCVLCEHPATVVDHIIPARSKPEWFWRAANHQPLCDRCHNRKRATADKGY